MLPVSPPRPPPSFPYLLLPTNMHEVSLAKLLERNQSFSEHPSPCIGQFQFLHPILTMLPWYHDVLAKLKARSSLLDVGCGFGQDLRFLTFVRTPTTALWGMDTNIGL